MGNCLTTGTAVAAATSSRGHAKWRRDRGRRGSSEPASALVREQDLHLVPGRIFSNDGNGRASAAAASSIYTQQGRKGINQDSMIIWEDFGGGGGILCGVFDGHGPQGHLVARKVRDALPLKLLSSLPGGANPAGGVGCCPVLTPPPRPPRVAEEEEPSPVHSWRRAFVRSYKAVDKELRSHPSLDCFCSGSTAVIVLKLGSDLFMGNIGDSRAVLGSKADGDRSMVAVQLTVDLKPDLPKEAERIKRCRGRVFALQDEPEVQRVWLPFDDAPGLAMARAFGDFCLKDYGVISVPEFSHWSLTERDQFVVLASDGVWDVLTNQEVVDIVSSSPTRSSAAKFLVDAATREWKLKYPTSKMDDCTVVCLYLDGKMDSDSVSTENNYSTAVYHDDGCHTNGPREESSEEAQSQEPYLDRNFTMRALGSSGVPPPVEGKKGASGVTEDQNWLGLEAVTRVNSLVQLPRFSNEDVTV